MNISKYKAVIFDLDGTIADSMWIWKDIDIDYLKKHGYDLPDNLQREIEGMSTTETAQYFKNRFAIADDIDTIKAEWIEMAHDYYQHSIQLKPGVKAYLNSLKAKGLKIGLATSNFRDLAELFLNAQEILDYFDAIRTSCEFDRGKPYPDVYLGVASDLMVKPEDCLAFEDTHAGILAAKRAGMDVIAVADATSAPYIEDIKRDADRFIDDFNEVLSI